MRRRGAIAVQAAEPDTTPLLDIVFILIIFFVVTATFTRETGFELIRDPGQAPTEASDQSLTFQMMSGARIVVQGRLIDIWSAEALIEQYHAERPDAPIGIKLGEGVPLGEFIRLYDVAKKAGLASRKIAVL